MPLWSLEHWGTRHKARSAHCVPETFASFLELDGLPLIVVWQREDVAVMTCGYKPWK